MYFFALGYNRPQLLTAAKTIICRSFTKVTRGTEFLHLSAENVCEILSFTELQCYTEVDVYTAGEFEHVHIFLGFFLAEFFHTIVNSLNVKNG